LQLPKPQEANLTFKQQLGQLDPIGTAVFLPGIICLILALQWGGTEYAWSSWRVILLLALFSVLIVVFGIIQVIKGDNGTIPPRILFQRSIAAGAYFVFCIASCMMIFAYYLPIWFQAVKGTTALKSGIDFIPTVLALVLAGIVGGQVTSRVGYYVPSMLISPVIGSIGAGLLSTLDEHSGSGKWIGYQVIFGLGLGLSMQIAGLAAQVVLKKEDVSIGTAIMMFSQQFGGTIFVAVGQNVFINKLVKGLVAVPGLGISPMTIVKTGATDLQKTVPKEYLSEVLRVYNYALTRIFVVGVAMMAVSILGSVFMEWKSIKKPAVKVDEAKAVDEKTNEDVEKGEVVTKKVEATPT